MLKLLTFGTLALKNGQQITVGVGAQRSRLAILAVLAAAGERGITREKLLGYFWAEADEAHARQALKQASYALRQAAGTEAVVVGGARLRLNQAVIGSDIGDLQAASAAGDFTRVVDLYRGPFLDGVYVKNAPEFERWADVERTRLARSFEEALDHLAKSAERDGDWHAAVKWRRRLAEHDPISSRAAVAFMQALERAGDVSSALQEGRAYDSRIADELQSEPDVAVAELSARLRAKSGVSPALTSNQSDGPDRIATETRRDALRDRLATRPRFMRKWDRRLRTRVIIGVALVAATVSLSSLTSKRWLDQPSSIGRVLVLPIENQTGDTAFALFGRLAGQWIADGLAQTGLVDVVDGRTLQVLLYSPSSDARDSVIEPRLIALRSGAQTVLVGRMFSSADSLIVHVNIVDAATGRIIHMVHPAAIPVREKTRLLVDLRGRVAGAIATLSDPYVASLADVSSLPPTMDAYREYAIGLSHYVSGDFVPALNHFQRAAAADTLFDAALVWQVYALESVGRNSGRDSVVTVLATRRERLSALHRHALDYFLAQRSGDVRTAYESAVRASRLAPRSEWTFNRAEAAMKIGRYGEAVQVLRSLDPQHSWVHGWYPYNTALIISLHLAGEHRAELEATKEARRHHPDNFMRLQGQTFAALGDTANLHRMLEGELQAGRKGRPNRIGLFLRFTALELLRHGHPDAARDFFQRCVHWTNEPSMTAYDSMFTLFSKAECLYGSGQWEQARASFEDVAARRTIPGWQMAVHRLAMLALRRGDSSEAAGYLKQISGHFILKVMPPLGAVEAAIRGDRAKAFAIIRSMPPNEAYGQHLNVDIQTLWTYPPYVKWIRGTD